VKNTLVRLSPGPLPGFRLVVPIGTPICYEAYKYAVRLARPRAATHLPGAAACAPRGRSHVTGRGGSAHRVAHLWLLALGLLEHR
jgi:hypothetical protein